VNLQRCTGSISSIIGKGDLKATECEGELVATTGSGNVHIASCSGDLVVKAGSGDIFVNRPREQCLSLNTSSGNIMVRDGSIVGLAVRVARGDVSSSARLHLPPEGSIGDNEISIMGERIDLGDLDLQISQAVQDAMNRSGARLNLAEFGFTADDAGLRITRGGVPVFEADDRGVRFKKGNFAFEAGDTGVRIKRGSRAGEERIVPGTFDVETHSGNISLDVPYGAALRVEALVTSGEVRSDVPLVTVGRPGPRGSTQRYVGGTTPGADPRMSLRLKTDRGDIRVRAVHSAVVPPPPPPPSPSPDAPTAPAIRLPAPGTGGAMEQSQTAPSGPPATPVAPEPAPLTEREERMQAILESLASGSLSVAEAERLLAALDTQNS
jgi:hypothetical protein